MGKIVEVNIIYEQDLTFFMETNEDPQDLRDDLADKQLDWKKFINNANPNLEIHVFDTGEYKNLTRMDCINSKEYFK